MASRSDSGNETRGSSESDTSPTPTKELQTRSSFTSVQQRVTAIQQPPFQTPAVVPTPRSQINTRTTPVSRTTPTMRPIPPPPTAKIMPVVHRLTPTAQRWPVRPIQRRPPSSGMPAGVAVPPLGSLNPIVSSRGRQRNSVAVVDSRDHIYEELDICRGTGPPKITPVSGVLQQGKVVIRPIAFKPVVPQPVSSLASNASPSPVCINGAIQGRPDPRYTSTPTLSRGPIQHYGSMGDLKYVGNSSSYSLDRRILPPPQLNSRAYYDPFDKNNKFSTYTKVQNSKNNQLNKTSTLIIGPNNVVLPNDSNHDGLNSNIGGGGPPAYPQIPPRPPSHLSAASNVDDCHQRYQSYEHSLARTTPSAHPAGEHVLNGEIPRYESLVNLSSTESHGPYPTVVQHGRHYRINGSITNLTRLHHTDSMSGSHLGLDRSLSVTSSNVGLDRSVSGSHLRLEGSAAIKGSLTELRLGDHHQTPSPSDSGVAELEAMLKEKDSEISNLRETMEQNEHVIFKVYEEKEKTWERELKKIRDLYDSRLRAAQQKALKVEQSLTTQTYQLQQERRKLSAELEEAKREKESGGKQVEQLRKELSSLRSQLEETEWSLCQKSGEISLLKTQLKDSQGDQTTRGHELLHLRAQVRQYQQEVERRRAEITSLHDLTVQLKNQISELRSQLDTSQQTREQGKQQQLEKCLLEMDTMKRERAGQKKAFEEERVRWVEEKERVIRYQKQLHNNYVLMLTRNRQLEEEVARLTGVPLPPMPSTGQGTLHHSNSNVPKMPSSAGIHDSCSESRC